MSAVIENHHDEHDHGPAKALQDGFSQLIIKI